LKESVFLPIGVVKMTLRTVIALSVLGPLVPVESFVQAPSGSQASSAIIRQTVGDEKDKSKAPHASLRLERVKIASELAQSVFLDLKCDSSGNLFIRSDPDGFMAIQKLSPRGERLGLYQAKSPDVKVDHAGYFSLGPDGDVYQIIMAHEITRYVFVYNADGTVRSEIKLQPGFPFVPSKVAVFPSGDLLVAGLEYDKDRTAAMWPFTGIFSSDGSLRKEVALVDDENIRAMAASGDPKVVSPQNPSSDRAVMQGAAETSQDGNVYLMRRLSPAIVYAISPGGAVIRRFTVDPGEGDFMPVAMHAAGGRMAILFRQEQTRKEIIKVVDLEGHETATYDEPVVDGKQALGMAFACYASNPEHFVFLTTMDDARLGVVIATPQ